MSKRTAIVALGLAFLALALWVWADRGPSDEGTPVAAAPADPPTRRTEPLPPAVSVAPPFVTDARATVTGRVVTREGTAVASATVCGQVETVADTSAIAREPACTKTDADGTYRLEGLYPLQYVFDASAPRFAPTRHTPPGRPDIVALASGQTHGGVDFVLEPGVQLSGTVRDISGGAIADALLIATRGEVFGADGRAVVRSDADGRFEVWVDAGSVSVTAQADGYARGGAYGQAPGADLEVVLTPEAVVVGSVRRADTGEPVAGIKVELQRSGFMVTSVGATYTDERGRFRVDRLEPGVVRPTARSHDLFGQADSIVVGLMQTSDPVVIEVHAVPAVRGRVVVAGGGEPCVEGTVALRGEQGESAHAAIRGDGTVELSPVQPGTYAVAPSCYGYLSAERYEPIEVGEGGLHDLVWEVRRGATLRGTIVDAKGQPAPGFLAVARLSGPGAKGGPMTMSAIEFSKFAADDGSFEITGLAAGTHSVHAIYDYGPTLSDDIDVALVDGETREGVVLELRETADLSGEVRDAAGRPLAGVVVRAIPDDGVGTRTQTDAAGHFRVAALVPGPGNLFLSEKAFSTRLRRPGSTKRDADGFRYDAPAGESTEVSITVEAADGEITGRVVDSDGGPVADAFVDVARLGDGPGASRAAAMAKLSAPFRRPPTLTDVSGAFTMTGIPAGTYVVKALRKGGGTARAWDVPAGGEVTLEIQAPSRIAGTVRLSDGGTPERFGLHVDAHDRSAQREVRYFKTEGRWSVGGLPPGGYRIIATATQGTAIAEVEVEAGEERGGVALVLTPRVTVRGRVVELQSGRPVPDRLIHVVPRGNSIELGGAASAEKKEVTGEEGRFEVTGAPTGDVTVAVTSSEPGPEQDFPFVTFVPRRIDTEGATEVDIGDVFLPRRRLAKAQRAGDLGFTIEDQDDSLPVEERRLVVAEEREGGPASDSGLRAGDVIVSVDGHDVRGMHGYLYSPLASVPPGTSLDLGLAREASVTIVAAEPR